MRFSLTLSMVILVAFLCTQDVLMGFDQEDMIMHGFASQGYLRSSDNHYLGNSKDGSFEFNEIGVNFMVPVTDELRFGIQFFSRDLGDYGNNDLMVDWALLDYNVNQYLGFRAGKVKMPFGFRNRSRDVDNLRTQIVLNQSVYMEGIRDLIIATYGFNLYGNIPLGGFGDMDYDLLAGTLEIPYGSPFLIYILERMAVDLPALGGLNLSDISVNVEYIVGGQFRWATPISGLSLSVTDYKVKFDVGLAGLTGEAPVDEFSTISIKYDIWNVSFIAERFVLDYDFKMPLVVNDSFKIDGWYGEVSYQVVKWMALGLSYGEFYPDAYDKSGNQIEDGNYPDYYAWQKDTTFSTKFNINEYLCVKFEVHYYDGLGLTNLGEYVAGEMKKHWFLYAFKTSINF